MKKLKRLRCYIRPYRLNWGLSQADLAYIVGFNDRKFISQLERHQLPPTLAIALALHLVFGTDHAELFPELCAEIEKQVIARAYDLYERLQGNTSRKIRAKLDLLELMLDRMAKRRDLFANV